MLLGTSEVRSWATPTSAACRPRPLSLGATPGALGQCPQLSLCHRLGPSPWLSPKSLLGRDSQKALGSYRAPWGSVMPCEAMTHSQGPARRPANGGRRGRQDRRLIAAPEGARPAGTLTGTSGLQDWETKRACCLNRLVDALCSPSPRK